jgi:UDP-N-acetylglucosamine:LPS N-acetylglucosamine transferase
MRPEAEKYKSEDIKAQCREKFGIAKDAFVVALCDGGYGMARLEGTVERLVRANEPMTIIALCGMNHELYLKLDELSKDTPEHIQLIAVDFTDKMLEYLACADLFAGKSGANAIAEPASMGVPIIVTKCITYIERGIKNYYVKKLKGAMYIPSCRRAAKMIRKFAANRELLAPMRNNLLNDRRQVYDAKASADLIWKRICELRGEE